MNRLVVRNIGPIKSVDIRLNTINVFIGPQSSGKSTLAKIISFCTWLEKVNDSTDKVVAEGIIKHLKLYHRFEKYFRADSCILYIGENIAFAYNWKAKIPLTSNFRESNIESINEKEVVFYALEKRINPKVIYIPAERNFVSSTFNLKKYAENNDSLQSFINDWYEAKRHFTLSDAMPIMNLGVKYGYEAQDDRDYIILDNGKPLPLDSSSSGLQSLVPLEVLVNWLSSGIYAENKPFSPDENERIRNILSHLSKDAKAGMESELVQRLRGFIQGKVYTHTQFIVEEPEQNLFPRTQMDLLYYLLSSINHQKGHHLVITTHSPYILYALNNAMLAYHVRTTMPQQQYQSLECTEYAVDPSTVSVWSIKDGYLRDEKNELHKTIQDENGLIRKNYFNAILKQIMGEFNDMLEYYE